MSTSDILKYDCGGNPEGKKVSCKRLETKSGSAKTNPGSPSASSSICEHGGLMRAVAGVLL